MTLEELYAELLQLRIRVLEAELEYLKPEDRPRRRRTRPAP
jgi:hypothetical protein